MCNNVGFMAYSYTRVGQSNLFINYDAIMIINDVSLIVPILHSHVASVLHERDRLSR
jgi:hypothetical protein